MSAAQKIGRAEPYDVLEEAKRLCGPASTTHARDKNGKRIYTPGSNKERLAQQKRFQARLDFVESLMARDLWVPLLGRKLGALWCPDGAPKWQRQYLRKIAAIAHHRISKAFDPAEVRRNVMAMAETVRRENVHTHPRIALRAGELSCRIAGVLHGDAQPMGTSIQTTVNVLSGPQGKALQIGTMSALFRGRANEGPKALPEVVEMEKPRDP